MGIDKQMVKEHLQQKIQAFLTDITPTVYKTIFNLKLLYKFRYTRG